MATRPSTWPQSTKDLLPHILFKLADQYPGLTYAEYPRDHANIADGFRKATYREVANAVHAFAWWIEKNVGKPKVDDGRETMVYIGPNDLRYGILVLGSVMVGYKMLFPSPRYGTEALAALIDRVDGTIMLRSSTPFPVVDEVLQNREMRTFQIPSLEDLLSAQPDQYQYTKTFESSKHEPLISLHTSGTTGFPKPVIWTHDWANSVAESHYMPSPDGYERMDGLFHGPKTRVMFMFPPFHASGFFGSLFWQLLTGTTVVYPPAAASPQAQVDAMANALDYLDERVDIVPLPPPHMEYLGANPPLLDRVSKKVKTTFWGGGDISTAVGNAVAAKMQLFVTMGSTELGLWPAIRKSGPWNAENVDEHWHYMRFHPAQNIKFVPVSDSPEGQLYEAVMVRNNDSEWVQPIFKINTEDKEANLGDLYTQHPQDAQLWKYYGRSDDLLVFITSEKFHPGAAERRIASHPSIVEVMIVGTRRPKASLIVKLSEGAKVEDIRATIEEVNKASPVYARVTKDMILIVKEPFLRTPKGTVQKKAMVDLYAKELDALYSKPEASVPMP
ncbi:Nn.00g023180.m01.CDS01 [Neocucurbitaria sp. VM-36]